MKVEDESYWLASSEVVHLMNFIDEEWGVKLTILEDELEFESAYAPGVTLSIRKTN